MEWFSGYTVALTVLIVGILFVITLALYLKSNRHENGGKISAKPIVISSLFVIALFLVFAVKADKETNPFYEISSGGKISAETTPPPTESPTVAPINKPTASPSHTPTHTPASTPAPDSWVQITEYDVVHFELPSSLVKIDSDRIVIYKDINLTLTIIRDEVDDSTDWWSSYKRTLYNNSFEEIDEYETQVDDTPIHHLEYLRESNNMSLHCVTSGFSYDGKVYVLTISCEKKHYKRNKQTIDRFVSSIKVNDTKKPDLKMTSEVSHGLEYLIPQTWSKETVEGCTYYSHDDCYLMVYKSKVDKEPIEVWNDYDKAFLNGYKFYRSEDIYINENKMDYIEYLSSDEANHSATFIFIYDKHMCFFTIVTPNTDDIFIENKEILMTTMHSISKAS